MLSREAYNELILTRWRMSRLRGMFTKSQIDNFESDFVYLELQNRKRRQIKLLGLILRIILILGLIALINIKLIEWKIIEV